MDEYIAAYKAHIGATRFKILYHFYKKMAAQQRFEVVSSLMVAILIVIATLTMETNNLAIISIFFVLSFLSIYMVFYILQRNFHRTYFPLYAKFGEKIEFYKDEYIRYLLLLEHCFILFWILIVLMSYLRISGDEILSKTFINLHLI